MNQATKNQVKFCLKTSWLVAVVAILLMGTTVCGSSAEACSQTGKIMFVWMFLLTFPAGVFFFVVSLIFVDPSNILDPSDLVIAWLVMAIGGLVQWFLLVPNLFEEPGLMTLNLNNSQPTSFFSDGILAKPAPQLSEPELVAKDKAGAELNSPQPAVVSAPSRQPRRKITNSVAAFDRKGRTPLERVINHS